MPRSRSRFSSPSRTVRGAFRDRHGRGLRGSVTGPHLPMLRGRIDVFDMTVASTVEYLRGMWADELAHVHFEIGAYPDGAVGGDGVERWRVDREHDRVVLYRLPIQRLSKLHRNDEFHQRMMIESCVFRAVAELMGKDPWDLAPGGFHH
ncbi:metallopeptidase family protein [Homoserinimonas sp. OAct 916]|uniref:metallopeptidase family protein n=1 Tax=Homoserinimonas sp. OAct 916 TaxID=2211450 RepID=UPI000DBE7611|nr:metallopeptidase family protein [Homoserinimonas sp. OAct 916]